jgi:hypothetical protein
MTIGGAERANPAAARDQAANRDMELIEMGVHRVQLTSVAGAMGGDDDFSPLGRGLAGEHHQAVADRKNRIAEAGVAAADAAEAVTQMKAAT